ncbi:YSIRK-type signal peptide-containing protein [Lactobacillus mulieris]|jgi:adhesion exoprotein|uniref:mucin-binding protein n=1 Tax=Lactobacillus mulieris TaxID=2508708 RepID=UPI0001B2AF9F|nr:YSIRK-type signal peptide-containing protein [Lactobacillus mulieris]EEU20422.1 YSIRK family Gram-positive signal peptide [Lactobacillus jensenii 27-2-CHN]EEX23508.1 Gram-positive signal peptide protein, YSIRK family [Lactobacillus jensenii 115-3-CHN]KAA9361689.1 YSIRK-type signal peptide-containing protein [Lactobacillus jensenii]MCF1847571.1 YSIRK-type signal peptide-containing protein [Lactobacillus mulieris]MCW8106332.1 YSIRK-type signal peptide-containing protein [Lactobacillus mulieri
MSFFNDRLCEEINEIQRFSFRKTSIGLASFAISSLIFLNWSTGYALADTSSSINSLKLNNTSKIENSDTPIISKNVEVNSAKDKLNREIDTAQKAGFNIKQDSDKVIKVNDEVDGLEKVQADYAEQASDIKQQIKDNQSKLNEWQDQREEQEAAFKQGHAVEATDHAYVENTFEYNSHADSVKLYKVTKSNDGKELKEEIQLSGTNTQNKEPRNFDEPSNPNRLQYAEVDSNTHLYARWSNVVLDTATNKKYDMVVELSDAVIDKRELYGNPTKNEKGIIEIFRDPSSGLAFNYITALKLTKYLVESGTDNLYEGEDYFTQDTLNRQLPDSEQPLNKRYKAENQRAEFIKPVEGAIAAFVPKGSAMEAVEHDISNGNSGAKSLIEEVNSSLPKNKQLSESVFISKGAEVKINDESQITYPVKESMVFLTKGKASFLLGVINPINNGDPEDVYVGPDVRKHRVRADYTQVGLGILDKNDFKSVEKPTITYHRTLVKSPVSLTKTIHYIDNNGKEVKDSVSSSVTVYKTFDPTNPLDSSVISYESTDSKIPVNSTGKVILPGAEVPLIKGAYAKIVPSEANNDSEVSVKNPTREYNIVYNSFGKIIPVDESGKEIQGADTPTYNNNSDDPTKAGDTTTPTVPGYTATKTTVSGSDITNPGDNTKVIYTANNKTTNIVFKDQDNNNKVVNTVPVDGYTSETVPVDGTKTTIPDGYELVPGNQVPTTITFAGGDSTTPDIVVYLKHKHTITTKNINKKITYQTTDGNTVADSYKTSITIAQDVDEATNTATYKVNGEITTKADLTSQDVPAAPTGYHLDTNQSTGDYNKSTSYDLTNQFNTLTDGQTVNAKVVYAPDKQTITVTVHDSETNTDVTIPTIIPTNFDGTTSGTVDITDGINKIKIYLTTHGYTVPDTVEVPKNFDNTDNGDSNTDKTPQPVTITVGHKTTEVKPDSPKTTDDNLPDNPDKKYPSGVTATDLNKTITRTILEVDPVTKESKTVATQTVHYTRTATVDEVTGKVAYTNWATTDKWASYTAPDKPGYTPSQKSVDETTPSVTDKDQTVTITYSANPTNTNVVFVDDNDNGKTVKTVTVDGTTGGTTPLSSDDQKIPAGYELVPGNTIPTEIKFNNDGSQTPNTTIHLKHKTITVNSDSPKTTDDNLPDNPDKKYPSGVTATDLNKTITRTIVEVDPVTGEKKTVATQSVHYTRTATVDEVNGKVTYSDWTTTDKWASYTAPDKPGYTPSQTSVEEATPAVTITYTGNPTNTKVIFVDDNDNGKTIKTVPVNGVTGGTTPLSSDDQKIPDGYELVDGNKVPTEIKFNNDGSQTPDTTIHLKHKTVDVTPDSPAQPGDKLPDNPNKYYPDGVDTTKVVTRTINVHKPDGTTETITQTVTFTRTVTVDEVTGKVISSTPWTSTNPDYPEYTVPSIDGYTPSQSTVKKVTPKDTDSNSTVDVTYTGNTQTIKVVAVDKTTGKEVTVDVPTTFNGKSDENVGSDVTDGVEKIKNYLKNQGYTVPETIEIPTNFDHSQSADSTKDDQPQVINITVDHTHSSSTEDKTVTRTIIVKNPNGTENTTKQTVIFTRTVTTDNVTGDKTYSSWTTDGTSDWNEFTTPTVAGYTPSQSIVEKVTPSADDSNQTITIDYSADKQVLKLRAYDVNIGSAVEIELPSSLTTEVDGASNGTVDVDNVNTLSEAIKSYLASKGYSFVSSTEAPTKLDTDDSATQYVDLTFNHAITPATEDKTVTRTIIVKNPDGTENTTKQEVTFTRTVTTDNVKGDKTYGSWTTDGTSDWNKFTTLTVAGYTPSQSTVEKVTPSADDSDQTVTIDYSADKQTIVINYVDKDSNNKLLTSVTLTGFTGDKVEYSTAETIKNFENAGYELVSDNFSNNAYYLAKMQIFTVVLKHDPILKVETKQFTYTVHYVSTDGVSVPEDNVQVSTWKRTISKDLVTGIETPITSWTSNINKYKEVITPEIARHYADTLMVDSKNVLQKNIVVTVTYKPEIVLNNDGEFSKSKISNKLEKENEQRKINNLMSNKPISNAQSLNLSQKSLINYDKNLPQTGNHEKLVQILGIGLVTTSLLFKLLGNKKEN